MSLLDGKIINQIDHMVIDKKIVTSIIDVKIKTKISNDSNHFLIQAKFSYKIIRIEKIKYNVKKTLILKN